MVFLGAKGMEAMCNYCTERRSAATDTLLNDVGRSRIQEVEYTPNHDCSIKFTMAKSLKSILNGDPYLMQLRPRDRERSLLDSRNGSVTSDPTFSATTRMTLHRDLSQATPSVPPKKSASNTKRT